MKSFSALLILMLVAMACGGGSSSSPQDSRIYRGKTGIASLDQNNNVEFLNTFFGQLEGSNNTFTKGLNPISNRGLRYFLLEIQGKVEKLSYQAIENDTFFDPSLSGLFGGEMHYFGQWTNDAGQIFLSFSNFRGDADQEWNGRIQVDYIDKSPFSENFQSLEIQFSDFSIKDENTTIQVSGLLSAGFDLSTGDYYLTWDCLVVGSDFEYKLVNYKERGFKTLLGFGKATFNGDLYHNQFGQVYLSTVEPIEFQGQLPSRGGPIIIQGTGGSKLKVTPEGFGLIHYELDQDGDGVYESIYSQSHYQVEVY